MTLTDKLMIAAIFQEVPPGQAGRDEMKNFERERVTNASRGYLY